MKKILLCFFLLLSAALFADRDQLHRKAALEMMQASGVPHMLKRSFEAQLEYQIKAVPEPVPADGLLRQSLFFQGVGVRLVRFVYETLHP